MPDSFRLSFDLPLAPSTAFDLVIEEVASALALSRIRFDTGPGGRVLEDDVLVGEVVAWDAGRRVALRWRPAAAWQSDATTRMELAVAPSSAGSTVTFEHSGWGRLLGEPGEMAGWVAGQVLAPLMRVSAPLAFGDWLTDRRARRPSGAQSRATYADPLYHYPNFRVILEELALAPGDHLLEVGCGGGALLKAALERGCRAAAIDHSPEMVRLARQANAEAVTAGRLEVVEGTADALTFADGTFTCAAMTGVLGFLPDPVTAFAEVRRVLRPGGRFVALGSDPELRGTPAAPEPMASRLRFYEDHELEQLARAAGFDEVRVVRRDLERYARDAGVPEEHVPLFAAGPGKGARFLVCRR